MAHNGFADLLKNRGFRAFLWTQFLGAFNDQVYQSIVALHALRVRGGEYVPLVLVIFNLPFLLFSGYSGHLSDRVSKRSVLVGVKVFEIFVMAVGLAAFLLGRIEGMLLVVFLMGLHSTVFGPAKYGIVPEMAPDEDLSRANALLEMTTFMAIVLGVVTGTFLYVVWADAAWRMGAATLGIAVAGFLASRGIPRVRAAGGAGRFRWNPFAEIGTSTRRLLANRPLWLAVLGVSFFWAVGALLRSNLEYFGVESLQAGANGIGILWGCLAIGIGSGNMLAGRWSGNKVELGLVPLGSGMMAVFAIAVWASRGSFALSAVSVALLAVASGLFVVPLYAFIQQRSGSTEKGRVVATNNFYQTVGMLIASGLLSVLHNRLHVSAAAILLGLGILTLLLTVYIVTLVPECFVRFLVWLATHTVFRIRVVGEENAPLHGPALLVANHMSHVDGFLIGATVQRFIRFVVWKPYYEAPALNWFFRLAQAIPADGSTRREAVRTIHAARQALAEGHVVCVFAEGAVSRTGNLLPFKRGLEKMAKGLEAPIIPVHLDRLWGSIFSYEGGRFFWKWPKRIPYPVTVSFGAPMPASSTAGDVRQAIQELGSDAWQGRKKAADLLDRRLIRNARRRWGRFAVADSTGRKLTWGGLLTEAVMVSNRLHSAGCRPGDHVGVLLPASAAGAAVNMGITLAGCVAVNLDSTTGFEAISAAVEQCRIQTIVTWGRLEPAGPDGQARACPTMVFVDDIPAGAGASERLRALLAARFAPAASLSRGHRTPDSPAAVIFSSGEGAARGVVLSHYNVISNIEAVAQVISIGERDRVAGVLPFFDSFGFTATLWFPAIAGCGVVYANPKFAQGVGELVERYGATLLPATPALCADFARECSRLQFATVRCALAGGGRLLEPVAAAFREKFGISLLAGYGCAEMSPVVAVNGPDFEDGTYIQTGNKSGTAGHPLPGVAARIVDPVTMETLAPNQEGLLLVKGPGRMLGYLGRPDLTAAVFHGDWYSTGDAATIDDDGFIRITDRFWRCGVVAGDTGSRVTREPAAIISEQRA